MSYLRKGDLVSLRKGIAHDCFPPGEIGLVLRELNEVGKTLVLWNDEKRWVYFEDLVVISCKTP